MMRILIKISLTSFIKILIVVYELDEATVNELIESTEKYNEMATASNPFGDGTASLKITAIIKEYFNVK